MSHYARVLAGRNQILPNGEKMTAYTVEVLIFGPENSRFKAEDVAIEEVEKLDVDEWAREFKRQTGKDCHV